MVVITTILMKKRFFVNKIEIEKEIKSDWRIGFEKYWEIFKKRQN